MSSYALILPGRGDRKPIMIANSPDSVLPHPLQLLQQTQPGMLYTIVSRERMLSVVTDCRDNIVSGTALSPDGKTLTLTCNYGSRVQLSGNEQLATSCDCHTWAPYSQCSHVAIIWIQLKRLLSPGSFPHIKISAQALWELSLLTGIPMEAPAQTERNQYAPLNPARAAFQIKDVRLVLERSYDRINGTIKHGATPINQWSRGLPRDIVSWLIQLPYYESTLRFFTAFTALTDGMHPIVYRNEDGTETPLTLSATVPRRACLNFSLTGSKVAMARTLDGTVPLADNLITAREILIDLDTGTIHPLENREVWKVWDNIVDNLLKRESYDAFDNDDDFDDDDYFNGENDYPGDSEQLNRESISIVASIERFNALALRLEPKILPLLSESMLFFHNGKLINSDGRQHPTYLLELPASLNRAYLNLRPMVSLDGQTYTFSSDLFRFFNQDTRSYFYRLLKAKKRARNLIAACFALAEAVTPAARKNLIKAAVAGPDYLKRAVKKEAKEVLATFVEEIAARPLMIQAAADGWHFAEDDHQAQVRLARILHDLFGADAFDSGNSPGEMVVKNDELQARLPLLAEQLQQGGFSLRMGGATVETGVWDFALDATASSHDWFELRPEIRCDGELLSPEELQTLASGGILQRDGKLILIDELSAQILAMLTGSGSSGSKRKRKEGREALRIPRLQILDWLQLRSRGVTVRLAADEARILESLLNFSTIPDRPLPTGLNATLRPYQNEGYQWLGFLYEHRFGACLADDMGLGKTIQGISLLAGIANGIFASVSAPESPHLVVVPPSLLFNWESEIARFFPGASVSTYTGSGRSSDFFQGHDIILTSYGIIQRDIEKLRKHRFNVIIFDEAQMVKNLQSATASAARRLVGSFKLALTGTPVENRIEEYYSIMDLCLPGLLGTPEEFNRSLGNRAQGGIDTLLRRTRPFILRRSKQLIAADLPEKIENDIHLELSAKQKALYQRTIEEVRSRIDEAFSSHSPGQARIIALTAILRLRQICLAPALAMPGATEASPKLDFLVEQLEELRDEGHSVLVFSQFTSYLDIVAAGLKHHSLNYLRLDGSTPVPQRKKLVQQFQESSGSAVFLISLKAGGKGLNLTRATYVYHLDPWWNPAVENQASDRAHRIGQTNQVTITRLIMRHTIEEKMMALKEQKFKLYKAILEEGTSGGGAGLTREDFDFLLG